MKWKEYSYLRLVSIIFIYVVNRTTYTNTFVICVSISIKVINELTKKLIGIERNTVFIIPLACELEHVIV